MPLFLVRRDVEPELSHDEVEAATFRAMCFAYLYENMRWVTSYWDRDGGRFYCVYEADNAGQIEEHSRRARIPCDEVRSVMQYGPEDYLGEPPPIRRSDGLISTSA